MSFNSNDPQKPGNSSPTFSSESGSSSGEKNGLIHSKPVVEYSEENFKKNNGYPGESDDEVNNFSLLENGGRILGQFLKRNFVNHIANFFLNKVCK